VATDTVTSHGIIVAWTGAALFAASLGYVLYFYLVALGQPFQAAPGSSPSVAAAIDIVLFAAFAAHHSIFARAFAKRRVERLVTAAFERSAYVWVASLLLAAVCWLWRPINGIVWEVEAPWRWVLWALQLAGILLSLVSARAIDVWELAGVRQVRRPNREAPAIFTISGPYGRVRHPIYLGWMLLVLATPAMTAGRLLFATMSTLYLVLAIPIEERSLLTEHGDRYRTYQRAVPWRLVPGVW
jgi:protein-S-isoprenylcysteine O-methyltransferase Ste14